MASGDSDAKVMVVLVLRQPYTPYPGAAAAVVVAALVVAAVGVVALAVVALVVVALAVVALAVTVLLAPATAVLASPKSVATTDFPELFEGIGFEGAP